MSMISIEKKDGTTVELELDLLDADVVERYELLMARIVKDINEPTQYKDISNADAMRKQCRIVDVFFNDLFGPGTADMLFDGGNNLGIRLDAFANVASVKDDIQGDMNSIISKYGFQRIQNREERRAAKKKHRRNN